MKRRAWENMGSYTLFPRLSEAERYRSGQTGQTVNLLAIAFGGSNPPLSTSLRAARELAEWACRERWVQLDQENFFEEVFEETFGTFGRDPRMRPSRIERVFDRGRE
jgi:hypothetical protein